MPKARFKDFNEFKSMFSDVNGKFGTIQTPYLPIKVKMFKAYDHFKNNTYNKNRENIKGGFFSTFKDPLFVVKAKNPKRNKPSVYFYKPFLAKSENNKENIMNLFSIAVDYDGNLSFKTYYYDNKNTRLQNIIETILKYDGEVVYIKSPNG